MPDVGFNSKCDNLIILYQFKRIVYFLDGTLKMFLNSIVLRILKSFDCLLFAISYLQFKREQRLTLLFLKSR